MYQIGVGIAAVWVDAELLERALQPVILVTQLPAQHSLYLTDTHIMKGLI
jgi:hypothetical protein